MFNAKGGMFNAQCSMLNAKGGMFNAQGQTLVGYVVPNDRVPA
jgi:hypothetical protein